MKANLFLAAAAVLAVANIGSGADRSSSERAPAKEPAYSTASPRYGMLLFGPKAATRVWIVVDGDAVYVDCNANGDLTEPGEKFKLSTPRGQEGTFVDERDVSRITVTDGRLKHTDLYIRQFRVRPDFEPKSEVDKQLKDQVAQSKQPFVYYLSVNVQVTELPRGKIAFTGRIGQEAGQDANGYLQFASRASDAPAIHFGGPFEMALLNQHTLTAGEKPSDLMTMIGTRGRGPGTFASVGFGGVFSDETHPVAEIEFPPKTPGATPPRERFVLKHRC